MSGHGTADAPPDAVDSPPKAQPGTIAGWFRSLRAPSPRVSLALQGGGAHGAFTWGVLDALLADPHLEFDGLSGSSAGAINAVVFANGWMNGGREGARKALADFWTVIGTQMPLGMVTEGEGDSIRLTAGSRMLASWAALFSPSQLNPLDLNPLRDLLADQIDFRRLRAGSPFKLFVGATQANTGKLRVFRENELTVEMLIASACLPKIHHSVNIDGEPYWDGGYSANPAVFPLFYECESRDVLLVLLSPLRRDKAPRTVEEIEARILELGFNAHFMREMRMFAQAVDYSSPLFSTRGRLERRLSKMRFHMIDSTQVTTLHRTDTKLIAYGPFLELLCAQGRAQAEAWLAEHLAGVGRHSTVDVKHWFS